ncbi:MAG: RluA family pseudouridine synthase [Planctomycetota bacterium]|nr:RluA family pseudouridine synthase [Planctomycetota bacterium]
MNPVPPVIHQDERLIALDKPTGLLSVPGIGPEKADCLAARVAAAHPGARIVHRLDRDTSGVIVMAFDAEAHRELSRQFQDRETEKTYHALVAGHPRADRGEIDLPIRKDLENTPLQVVDHVHGKPSLTRWTVTSRGELGDLDDGLAAPAADPRLPIARLELHPLTGRSHQLRVHLKELGHVILGDDLYAPEPWRDATTRLCLHASRLWIVHPGDGSPRTFRSAPPF